MDYPQIAKKDSLLIAVNLQPDYDLSKELLDHLKEVLGLACVVVATRTSRTARLNNTVKDAATYIVTADDEDHMHSGFQARQLRPLHSVEDIVKRHNPLNILVIGVPAPVVCQTAFDANALGYKTAIIHFDKFSSDLEKRLERAGIYF